MIVKNLVGHMRSRKTSFLTEDGEKEWRHRDEEFKAAFTSKIQLQGAWQKGWGLFKVIKILFISDLE